MAVSIATACRSCCAKDFADDRRDQIAASARAAWGAASPWRSPMPATTSRWSISSRAPPRIRTARGRSADEIRKTLASLARFGLLSRRTSSDRRHACASSRKPTPARRSRDAAIIFEGVPEVLDLKREALARASGLRRPRRHHRLDHLDHPGRRSLQRGRAARALSQRALAQPGLSGPAGRTVARRRDRSGRHRASEGAAGRHRQGAGGLRGDAGLHRAADSGAGHERSGADGGGRRRQRGRHRQGDQIRLRFSLSPWACWNSSTGAAAIFSITPAAISKAR